MMMEKNPARRAVSPRRGLTLIEVLIVIAILLAIGGLVLVNLMPTKENADRDTMRLQLQSIGGALDQYRLHIKHYPTEEEGLKALWDKSVISNEDEMANWHGPYLQKPIEKDSWGSELVYRPNETGSAYELLSIGPDKQEGTDDDINESTSQGTEGGMADTGDSFAPPPGAGSGGTGSGSGGGG